MLRNEGRESQSRRVQSVLELKDRTVWAKYTQQAVFFFIAAPVKDIGCQRGQRSEVRGRDTTSADPHPVLGRGATLCPCFESAFH